MHFFGNQIQIKADSFEATSEIKCDSLKWLQFMAKSVLLSCNIQTHIHTHTHAHNRITFPVEFTVGVFKKIVLVTLDAVRCRRSPDLSGSATLTTFRTLSTLDDDRRLDFKAYAFCLSLAPSLDAADLVSDGHPNCIHHDRFKIESIVHFKVNTRWFECALIFFTAVKTHTHTHLDRGLAKLNSTKLANVSRPMLNVDAENRVIYTHSVLPNEREKSFASCGQRSSAASQSTK